MFITMNVHDEYNRFFENMTETQLNEFWASVDGITAEERTKTLKEKNRVWVKTLKEEDRVRVESKKYTNLAIDQWPEFEIKWDLNPKNHPYTLDNNGQK